jgi:nucleotide-binding universal stress UspA family protein
MRGTLICGVNDRDDGHRALELAVELSERLELRLVLAHAGAGAGSGPGDRLSIEGGRDGSAHLLARLAVEYGVSDRAERRSGTGDAAALIGRIAAEEAADMIVVGARTRGWLRRRFESRLAEQLRSETPVPVLIALPRGRTWKSAA